MSLLMSIPRLWKHLVVAGLLAVTIQPLVGESDAPKPAAFVVSVTGKMEVKRVNLGVWQAASLGDHLMRGDLVRTTEFGKSTIQFSDGTIVKIAPNTELEVRLADNRVDGKKVPPRGELDMKEGDIYSEVAKNNKQEFRILTKTAVAAVKGTKLGVQANRERTTLLVYEGFVELGNAFGKVLADARKTGGGQVVRSVATGNAAPTAPVTVQANKTENAALNIQQVVKVKLDVSLNPAASPVGMPFKINLAVLDQGGKPVGGRSDKVGLSSSSKTMRFSMDGAKWSESLSIGLQDSKGSVLGMDTSLGGAVVSAEAPDVAPDNESVTIMPAQQKIEKKTMKGKIRTKDGKEFKFINEYQK